MLQVLEVDLRVGHLLRGILKTTSAGRFAVEHLAKRLRRPIDPRHDEASPRNGLELRARQLGPERRQEFREEVRRLPLVITKSMRDKYRVGGGPGIRPRDQGVEFRAGLQPSIVVEFQRKKIEALDGLHMAPQATSVTSNADGVDVWLYILSELPAADPSTCD